MTVHRFSASVKWSEGIASESDYERLYRVHFPDLIQAVGVKSGRNDFQLRGVDRILLLPGPRQVTVDEKVRDRDYGDFLCEEWSVWRGHGVGGNKIGWTLDPDKVCDYVAWIVKPTGRACLLPFDLLRRACRANLDRWKAHDRCRYPRDARNSSYVTRNIAVPWDLLWSSMRVSSETGARVVDPSTAQQLGFFEVTEALRSCQRCGERAARDLCSACELDLSA